MLENINLLAVFVSGVIYMIIGAFWYAPMFFGKAWMKAMNKKPEDIKKEDALKAMGISFLSSLVLAWVLAYFVSLTEATTFAQGAMTGFWAWLGFIASTHLIIKAYEDRKMPLYTIFITYQLVWVLLIGGLLAIWK